MVLRCVAPTLAAADVFPRDTVYASLYTSFAFAPRHHGYTHAHIYERPP